MYKMCMCKNVHNRPCTIQSIIYYYLLVKDYANNNVQIKARMLFEIKKI